MNSILNERKRDPNHIALFGGSFNPVHNGHIQTTRFLLEKGYVRHLRFLPNAMSPLKKMAAYIEPHHRVAMIQLAIENEAHCSIDPLEVERPPPSYTVDTVRHYDDKEGITFIIGEDNLQTLHLWKDIDYLLQRMDWLVLRRPGQQRNTPKLPHPWPAYFQERTLATPIVDISSSEIRSAIQRGKSIKGLVPDPVLSYIQRHDLYKNNK